MKKKMKDRPGLLDDAARIAKAGRGGDTLVAHINPEEAALLKARGGSGTVNPKTGLLEFMDEDGQGTTEGAATGLNGPPSDPSLGFWDRVDDPSAARNVAPPDVPSSFTYDENAQKAQYQPRDFFRRAADWALAQPREFVQDLTEKPFSTLANMALPGLLGLGNLAVGMMSAGPGIAGKTLTDRGIEAVAGLFNGQQSPTQVADGKPPGAMTGGPTGDPGGPASGTSDNYSTAVRPAPMGQEAPQQVAQEALRRAFMVNPELLNMWTGNKFTAAGTAGRPNAYNQWQGNQFMRPPVFPGLIG